MKMFQESGPRTHVQVLILVKPNGTTQTEVALACSGNNEEGITCSFPFTFPRFDMLLNHK